MAKNKKLSLPHGVTASASPSPSGKDLKKIMFYFGDTHSKYTIDSTKETKHKAHIADTIHTCSQFTRTELLDRRRHTIGGTEKIDTSQLRVPLTNLITPDVKSVFSMYVTKDHRMIGIFRENVFIVLFVDYKLKLYSH